MSLNQTNMIDPAQQQGKAAAGTDYPVSTDLPTDQQADLKAIMKLFYQWKAVRDMYSKPWLTYYQLYRGNQWGSGRQFPWKASEVVNLIWQSIQSTAPLQTDVRPRWVFLPEEPSDAPFCDILEKISDQDWDKYGWLNTILEVIYDGYIYGTGISSTKWDPTAKYGMGAPIFLSEDPFYCFPDPDCNDINDPKSEGFFHAYPMTTSKLKAKFPKLASKIKPDVKEWLKSQKADVKSEQFYALNKSTTHTMPESFLDSASQDCTIEKTLVIEGYLKPNDLEELVTAEQDNPDQKTYTVKKKYPKGRHVVIANGIFLQDEELPFDDQLIPFSKYINYPDPREFWGISEIEQLESPQRVFNRILSYALDIILYCSNPGWKVSSDAGVNPENVTNRPGEIIFYNKEGDVSRFEGSQLPPQFMQMLDRMVQWFNTTAGKSEFSEGNAPGGVTAASAIEQLISASRTRIRQKQRNLDNYMQQAGRLYLNRVLQYYTVPRIYRMTNIDGSQYWLKFNIETEDVPNDDGTMSQRRVAKTQRIDRNPETGEIVTGEVESMILKGELDVKVKAGSDLPFEAADKERKALALYDRQIIDAEEVLDQLQYPNKEKVLQRLQQRQEEVAAAQQQAEAQGQAPA